MKAFISASYICLVGSPLCYWFNFFPLSPEPEVRGLKCMEAFTFKTLNSHLSQEQKTNWWSSILLPAYPSLALADETARLCLGKTCLGNMWLPWWLPLLWMEPACRPCLVSVLNALYLCVTSGGGSVTRWEWAISPIAETYKTSLQSLLPPLIERLRS